MNRVRTLLSTWLCPSLPVTRTISCGQGGCKRVLHLKGISRASNHRASATACDLTGASARPGPLVQSGRSVAASLVRPEIGTRILSPSCRNG